MATPESTKKRKPNWNDDEVKILLRVWREYHRKLTTVKRNQFLYRNMAKEMELYGVFREASDIRCKIKNLTKMFKVEKAQEFVEGTSSKWRFYGKISEILGDSVNFIGYLKDCEIDSEGRPVHRVKGKFAKANETGQATILRLGFSQKSEEVENSVGFSQKSNEVENSDEDVILEPDESHVYNDETTPGFPRSENIDNQSSCNSFDATENSWEKKRVEENYMEELFQDYRDTKQSLIETDKQILELLSNQNDLIKTQNELCRTQNSILTSLLEKMK